MLTRTAFLALTCLALTSCLRVEEAKFKASAKETIARFLYDPGSAQYQRERVIWNGSDVAFCAEINSRNRMGGYVGFRRVFVDGKSYGSDKISTFLPTIEEEPTQADFKQQWERKCLSNTWRY